MDSIRITAEALKKNGADPSDVAFVSRNFPSGICPNRVENGKHINKLMKWIECREFDDRGNVVVRRLGDWNITLYEYDENGNRVKTTEKMWYRDQPSPKVTIMESKYDDKGNKTWQGWSNGNETTWEYNENGNVTKRTERKKDVITETFWTYNKEGNLVSEVVVSGGDRSVLSWEYDENGRCVKINESDGDVWFYKYDNNGNVIEKAKGTGETYTFDYDDKGRKLREVDADGSTWLWEYDKKGNVSKITYPSGCFVLYEYDENNNLLTTASRFGIVKHQVYDERGNLAIYADEDGSEYRLEYKYDGDTLVEITKSEVVFKCSKQD